MPTKRKAADVGRSSSDSKRATPVPDVTEISSSDEYSDPDDGPEDNNLKDVVNKFSLESFSKRTQSQKTDPRFGYKDLSYLPLKRDHYNRPLWIEPVKGTITLESFSPLAPQAQDFLTTIAEPLSRPTHLHEYRLTGHSLYAAVSVGLKPQDIVEFLDRLSKTPLPESISQFIIEFTKSYGKIKMVLYHNRYYVETVEPEMLQMLLKDEVIGPQRISNEEGIIERAAPKMGALVIPGTKDAAGVRETAGQAKASGTSRTETQGERQDYGINDVGDEASEALTYSFEIPPTGVEIVKARCQAIGCPALEEYDFQGDTINPNLDMDLKPTARIRPYQEMSLSKMFGNGRAKSGIIVLPCGAGKTLVGITAAATIKKGTIVLCTSSMSVVQWRNEFLRWTTIDPGDIAIFTSDHKEKFKRSTGIIVSTYSMVSQTRARSYDAKKMMDWLQSREWGMMILDEVHVVPASMFRKVTSAIAAQTKLGLTATLLREDDKIKDLNFLIGPKLYEANWMELAAQGHIAKVQCAEVWCPMTTEFYSEYLRASSRKQALLYIMNPRKFQACQYLIDFHEKRGDKIIVFSDNVYALEKYARKLNKAFIYGGTGQNERLRILENFQHNEQVNTIFLSKIGDTSLDLPEATCLIQISSHYGSRRQEAQRLGRILRAKRRNDEGFNAFFYSLVSKDTSEMTYSSKRQAFLVDQGYAFKVITHLQGIDEYDGLHYATPSERRELLTEVMLQNEASADVEQVTDDLFSMRSGGRNAAAKKAKAKRSAATLSGLAGGDDMAYIEYNKSRNKQLKDKAAQHPLFKKMERDRLRRKKERETAKGQ
ncbi:General transcription and DNA repair factor IIH helicase subunit XPB [Penicillium subrubescens]|uniref:General transcription and DNA repair factor IIH helicase subunit XPB n=1 Tax=Penicillium subrubescens TaxID=1316194 RepID=UPI0025451522|nr:General transcription and DNA repair factor IIH helicase subunit XPB [Penicillium subrubescens]KAJ5906667.1 General transcription and DNA repair factor IIH helicase subunit XPB [Penicillium subrubescens]